MKDDWNPVWIYVAVCLENIAAIVCFTMLAIVFNKWWIVLFSILLVSTIKTRNSTDKSNSSNQEDK